VLDQWHPDEILLNLTVPLVPVPNGIGTPPSHASLALDVVGLSVRRGDPQSVIGTETPAPGAQLPAPGYRGGDLRDRRLRPESRK
jgi:hypothetical protein